MLKKVMASVAMSAAALATLPAGAQEMPNLTPSEKETLKTYQAFSECVKQGAIQAQKNAMPVVEAILEARNNKANLKATIDAAKKSGLSEDQAKQLAGAMIQNEGDTLLQLLVMGEAGEVKKTCAKQSKIANKDGSDFSDDYKKKLGPLNEKMMKFFHQQDGAMPKPKGP